MARKPTGAVVPHIGKDGRIYYGLRFTAYGRRRFVSLGPVDEDTAERKLRITLDQVAEGTWQPSRAVDPPPEPKPVPTFWQLAEQWWLLTEAQLRSSTQTDYKWRLRNHLIPYFGMTPIDAIDYGMVKHYIAAKLGEDDPLSARSVNMTLTLACAIMEDPAEDGTILLNPFKGKRRRVRERAPHRSYLDTSDHIAALLAAAGELDSGAREDRQHIARRAMLATLLFAGLRLGELLSLRWRSVDLAAGWLHVTDAKTDAGVRRVKIRGALRDVLLAIKPIDADPDGLAFPTSAGNQHTPSNVRRRVLSPAVERASATQVRRGLTPLPSGLTPHSLRRTFASVLYAIGEDPPTVMQEMGHSTPELALSIYAHAMQRDDGEKQRLRALVEGRDLPAGEMAGLPKSSVIDDKSEVSA